MRYKVNREMRDLGVESLSAVDALIDNVRPKQVEHTQRQIETSNESVAGNLPPSQSAWNNLSQIANTNNFSGGRIQPRDLVKTESGYILLYHTQYESGSGAALDNNTGLAYSPDLENWRDLDASPLFSSPPPWADSSIDRARGRSLVYDDENGRWIMLVNSRTEDSTTVSGDRATGLAYSNDLINWSYESDPVITIDDLGDWHTTDRVYSEEILKHDGKYWVLTGQNEERGIITSTDLTNWSDTGNNPVLENVEEWFSGNLPKPSNITYFEGSWYMTLLARTTGDVGVQATNDLAGNWTPLTDNPLFNTEAQNLYANRAEALLIPNGGTWKMLISLKENDVAGDPFDLYSAGADALSEIAPRTTAVGSADNLGENYGVTYRTRTNTNEVAESIHETAGIDNSDPTIIADASSLPIQSDAASTAFVVVNGLDTVAGANSGSFIDLVTIIRDSGAGNFHSRGGANAPTRSYSVKTGSTELELTISNAQTSDGSASVDVITKSLGMRLF